MLQAFMIVCAAGAVALAAWSSRHVLPFRWRAGSSGSPRWPISADKRDGSIRLQKSRLALRPGLGKQEFLDSNLYAYVEKSRRYAFENGQGHAFLLSWEDPIFGFVYAWLNFENDRLKSVDFGWGPKITTAEWSHDRINSESARYRDIMMSQLGISRLPWEFSWGAAYAGRDDKAGGPAMGLVYRIEESKRSRI